MKNLFYIFVGGGVGSVIRFLVSGYTQKLWNISAFPVGTFAVNMVGCFLIGIFSAYFFKTDHDLKFLLITGFCGGFTTFSAFSSENVSLWESGQHVVLVSYILLSVIGGALAVYLGLRMPEY